MWPRFTYLNALFDPKVCTHCLPILWIISLTQFNDNAGDASTKSTKKEKSAWKKIKQFYNKTIQQLTCEQNMYTRRSYSFFFIVLSKTWRLRRKSRWKNTHRIVFYIEMCMLWFCLRQLLIILVVINSKAPALQTLQIFSYKNEPLQLNFYKCHIINSSYFCLYSILFDAKCKRDCGLIVMTEWIMSKIKIYLHETWPDLRLHTA